MGFESANYMLVPTDGVGAVSSILQQLGSEEQDPFPSSNFARWILRGERYWIDVMVGGFGPDRKPSVSIRIALSNPVEAVEVLHRILRELMERAPGQLFDSQTRRSYAGMSDEIWQDIQTGFEKKRERFQQQFGPFEAAISGEDVFPALNARKNA